MRLMPTLKKTVISLLIGLAISIILFVLTYFGYEIGIFTLIVIFIFASALAYLIWSMFQKEYDDEAGEEGEDYVPMYGAVEEERKERMLP